MKKRLLIFIICLMSNQVFAKEQPGASIQPDDFFPVVEIQTTAGKITVELDRLRAPITVNNFLFHVVRDSYSGTIFHRVIKDFVVQGGGYNENFEERPSQATIFNESGNGLKNEMFTIAMAREDEPHSAMRQFYFNMADNVGLDPGKSWGYAVFGVVTKGEEVLELISRTQTHTDPTFNWKDVPVKPILVIKATLLKEK